MKMQNDAEIRSLNLPIEDFQKYASACVKQLSDIKKSNGLKLLDGMLRQSSSAPVDKKAKKDLRKVDVLPPLL